MRKVAILITLIMVLCSSGALGQVPINRVEPKRDISIDHAYFRKLSVWDMGTVHLFIKNEGGSKVAISKVYANILREPIDKGEILAQIIPYVSSPGDKGKKGKSEKMYIWYRVLPNPLPPGEVANVMVKLSKLIHQPIDIGIETSAGDKLHRVIQPVDSDFRITFIGFNDELNKLYIYLENSGEEILKVTKVYLGTKEITHQASIPWKSISPREKKCIVVNLSKPLRQNQYISTKVETDKGLAAETVIRAFSFFPVNFERSTPQPELNLDPWQFTVPSPIPAGSTSTKTRAQTNKVCHLFSCPMHAHGSLNESAGKIISAAENYNSNDPLYPAYIHICRYHKEIGYFIYGELGDIVRTNPYIGSRYFDRYFRGKEDRVQWITDLAKKGCEPRPLHTLAPAYKPLDDTPYPTYRFPLPEELRLVVYYTISRGTKGVLYRHRGWTENDPAVQELKTEMCKINGELQVLKRFLKIGEPVSLAECNVSRVEPCTILAGDKAVVLILINHDYGLSRPEPWREIFTYTPKEGFSVTVHIPEGMEIKDVYEAGRTFNRLKYERDGRDIIIPIDSLDLTRQIVITTNHDDYNYDQDGDGASDIKEVAILDSHPDSLPVELEEGLDLRMEEIELPVH